MIDTQGYQSLQITTQALAATIQLSNDGANWSATQALWGLQFAGAGNLSSIVSSLAATSTYQFTCQSRYIKFVVTTAGYGTVQLRQQAFPPVNYAAPINIFTVSGSIVPTGNPVGGAGILAVGGGPNTAHAIPGDIRQPGATAGAAPIAINAVTQNAFASGSNTPFPVGVAGSDIAGYTRRILTDNYGRILVSGDPNAAAVNVRLPAVDGTGFGVTEILLEMLKTLKIISLRLAELPLALSSGTPPQYDEDTVLRDDPYFIN